MRLLGSLAAALVLALSSACAEPATAKSQSATSQEYLKEGVDVKGLSPYMRYAAEVVKQVYEECGAPYLITSGREGVHKHGSKHYFGQALDFRTSGLAKDTRIKIYRRLRKMLERDYDIVQESTHLHVEYDPK